MHLGLNSASGSVHQVRLSRSLSYHNPRLLVCYTCDHCSYSWCLNCTLPIYTWAHILCIVVVIYSLFYTKLELLFHTVLQSKQRTTLKKSCFYITSECNYGSCQQTNVYIIAINMESSIKMIIYIRQRKNFSWSMYQEVR